MKKKLSKKWIVLIVIVAIVVVLFGSCTYMGKKAQEAMATATAGEQTAEVTVRTLTKSVGATGTIVAAEKKEISGDLSGVKFTSVDVEVGDTVEAGQQLATLDTTDIENSLSDAEVSLGKTNAVNGYSDQSAALNVSDAQRNAAYTIDKYKTTLDEAYEAYAEAEQNLQDYADEVQGYRNTADSDANIVSLIQKALDGDENAKASLNEMGIEASAANKLKYEQEEATAEANYQAKNSSTLLKSYQDAVESAQKAVTSAEKEYNNAVATQNSSVQSAEIQQASTSASHDTTSQNRQISNYEEQIEDGVLSSPISGIVTAVNYAVGDKYTSGTIITIQDCSEYYVEAQIGEYDISDISEGQKVLIKTDATGDEQLEGTVDFISPVATTNTISGTTTTTSTSVTYKVKIAFAEPNDRLRLDMSASLSIIIDQDENAMTVPYNCVSTDEEGNSFVKVVRDGDVTNTVDIPVTIVMESNYYTEIESDQLKEGDTVLITEASETTTLMDMMTDEGGGF